MRRQIGMKLFLSSSVAALLAAGTLTAQAGGPVVIEDFESYNVTDGNYLDPTTVPGSNWTRTDASVGPDWEVACCSGAGNSLPPDYTLDGSDKALRLRRDDPGGDPEAVLFTDLAFDPMSEGSISFEVNPSARSGVAFQAILYDSVTKLPLARVRFGEIVPNVLVLWEVFAFTRGNPIFVYTDSVANTLDRWYRVTMTALAGTNLRVTIDDLGPTDPVSSSGGFALGELIETSWTNGSPVDIVDTLRLDMESGNGDSNDTQPTMIDNIAQEILVAAPPSPVSGLQMAGAVKVSFPTEAGKEYQPEFADDLNLNTWESMGPIMLGDGTTQCVFDGTAGVSDRAFRVLELDPKTPLPLVEGFEFYLGVGSGDNVDIATLSGLWSSAQPDSNPPENGPDWAVTCCFGGVKDDAFDGSDRQLSLRRDNSTSPNESELHTDFNLAAVAGGPISNGTVEVQMNPSSVGGSVSGQSGAFHLAFYDSSSGKNALRVLFRETQTNSGDFEFWDGNDQFLGEGTAPNGVPDAFDRWYEISFTIRNTGKMDIICTDIGPVVPGSTESQPARGPVFTLLNLDLPAGLSSVDTFRLTTGSMNGGNNVWLPTRIDNIRAGAFVPRSGDEIDGLEEPVQAREIQYSAEAEHFYQPQYSDDGGTTWFDLGPRVESTSTGTLSAFDAVTPGRIYQVLDLRP